MSKPSEERGVGSASGSPEKLPEELISAVSKLLTWGNPGLQPFGRLATLYYMTLPLQMGNELMSKWPIHFNKLMNMQKPLEAVDFRADGN